MKAVPLLKLTEAFGVECPDGGPVIELTTRGNVAVLRMNHGKANAMDLEFCEALTAQFNDLLKTFLAPFADV